jgi:hypothetical protein
MSGDAGSVRVLLLNVVSPNAMDMQKWFAEQNVPWSTRPSAEAELAMTAANTPTAASPASDAIQRAPDDLILLMLRNPLCSPCS